jgi:hypothetical protein
MCYQWVPKTILEELPSFKSANKNSNKNLKIENRKES